MDVHINGTISRNSNLYFSISRTPGDDQQKQHDVIRDAVKVWDAAFSATDRVFHTAVDVAFGNQHSIVHFACKKNLDIQPNIDTRLKEFARSLALAIFKHCEIRHAQLEYSIGHVLPPTTEWYEAHD